MLATTILRKAHKQWRILSHHALRMWSSPFTGDSVDVSFTRRDARLRAELMREADTEARAIAATAGTGKGKLYCAYCYLMNVFIVTW